MHKRIYKPVLLLLACIAVGSFLYSRRHAEYDWTADTDTGLDSTETGQQTQAQQTAEFPERYVKEVDDTLVFDAKIDAGSFHASSAYQSSIASYAVFDEKRIEEYFLAGEESVSRTVYEKNYYGPLSNLIDLTIYENEDIQLNISAYNFSYMKEDPWKYMINAFNADTNSEQYNADCYSVSSDLDFMDREAAWKEVQQGIEALGIDASQMDVLTIYSLDWQTMQREERCIDVNGNTVDEEKNPEWTQRDEGYYYYISQFWEGLPVATWASTEIVQNIDAAISIYQTIDGFVDFNLESWWQIVPQDTERYLASIDTIMAVIEEKYTGTIHTNSLTVTDAKLCVLPLATGTENVFNLEPVWICTLEEQGEDADIGSYVQYHYIPIHAVTAEELVALE